MLSKYDVLHEWERPKLVSLYESCEGYKLAKKIFRLGVILSVGLGLPAYLMLKRFVPAEFDFNWEKMFLVFGLAVILITGVMPVFFAWLNKFETVKYRITEKGITFKGPSTERWDKIKCFWFDEIEGLDGLTVIRFRVPGRNVRIILPEGDDAEDIVRTIEGRVRQVENPGKYYFKGRGIPKLAAVYLIGIGPLSFAMMYSANFVSEKYRDVYFYFIVAVIFVPAILIMVCGNRREKKMEEALLRSVQ